jgi:hypothetical protein
MSLTSIDERYISINTTTARAGDGKRKYERLYIRKIPLPVKELIALIKKLSLDDINLLYDEYGYLAAKYDTGAETKRKILVKICRKATNEDVDLIKTSIDKLKKVNTQ